MCFEVLQPEELARLEVTCGEWRAHDHFDDRRREAIHFMHARDERVIEQRSEFAPTLVALFLLRFVERAQLIAEEFDDVWIAIFRRRHRLDDVAGVDRVIVAVERDQLAMIARMLIRSEEAVAFDELERLVIRSGVRDLSGG